MPPDIVFGNANTEAAKRSGWFLGHFITPIDDPRSTHDLEVKWGIHKAGDCRTESASNIHATTIAIIIQGKFCLKFPDQDILLQHAGDYALWRPGIAHTWVAQEDSTVLTVRWPSVSGDSVEVS
ncbi:MAG: signal peptidase I [Hassallia sp.]